MVVKSWIYVVRVTSPKKSGGLGTLVRGDPKKNDHIMEGAEGRGGGWMGAVPMQTSECFDNYF